MFVCSKNEQNLDLCVFIGLFVVMVNVIVWECAIENCI
jgi:hypothetical protein